MITRWLPQPTRVKVEEAPVHRVRETGMSVTSQIFRTWLLEQTIGDTSAIAVDDCHYRFERMTAVAEINIYPYQEDDEIAEYQIVRKSDGELIFFLHVLLDDLERAKELFSEMAEALENEANHTTTHVLLCCTSALTTSMFAAKMNEVAQALSLDYDFTAMSADNALEAEGYDAILLAPQASHMHSQMAAAHPGTMVFGIPGKIFGSYDAPAAVRLVMHAFRESHPHKPSQTAARVARDLTNDWRILIVTLFVHRSYVRLGYRLYENGRVTSEGAVRKQHLDYRDIEDLIETLGARGVSVRDVNIVGIAVPGVAYHGTVSLPDVVEEDYDLRSGIEERFGLRVSVDNNCNAAAVGCYVAQNSYDSLVFYRHEFGHEAGGLGTVIDGTLLKGRHNLAGEPKYYESRFAYEDDYNQILWNDEGLFDLTEHVVLNSIALLAPEAIYLAVDTVDDMAQLHYALAQEIPEELIPPLFVVDDYVERVYLGEMALCLQKLRDPNYRSLGIA